jgi:hypothetical protein
MNAAAQQLQLQGAFPGFSAALEKAFNDYLGDQDVALSADKAQEFVAAIVWACQ